MGMAITLRFEAKGPESSSSPGLQEQGNHKHIFQQNRDNLLLLSIKLNHATTYIYGLKADTG